MTCSNCAMAATRAVWGGYSMNCVACCARLVRSARPLRHAQEAFLLLLARQPGRPSKAQVIEQLKVMDNQGATPCN